MNVQRAFLFSSRESPAGMFGTTRGTGSTGSLQRTMTKKDSKQKKVQITNCETCAFYTYDEEYGYYVCEADLDEDEMSAFLRGSDFSCGFYQLMMNMPS